MTEKAGQDREVAGQDGRDRAGRKEVAEVEGS